MSSVWSPGELAARVHAALPGSRRSHLYGEVVGLLRGRQAHSLSDPRWWPLDAGLPSHRGRGMLTLGELRCACDDPLAGAVVLAAHVLEERCPEELRALAVLVLAEGMARPVSAWPFPVPLGRTGR